MQYFRPQRKSRSTQDVERVGSCTRNPIEVGYVHSTRWISGVGDRAESIRFPGEELAVLDLLVHIYLQGFLVSIGFLV